MTSPRCLLLAVLMWLSATGLAAQEKGQFLVPIPEKLERATKADEQGVPVWVEFKAEPCVNCKGRKVMSCLHCVRLEDKDHESCPECKKTKEAVCRVCFGTGESYDILEKAPCPSCFGAAITKCFICNGAGRYPVEGGGDKPAKCGCCDQLGAYPCETCDGKRWVETAAVKPSVAEGKVKDLKKALEALEQVAAALEKFQSTGDGRKDIKEWNGKVLQPGIRYFPPLKRAQKHFEESTKKQSKGAVWKQYGDMVKNHASACVQALKYYVQHQHRVLELCIAHAEACEAADKKK